MLTVAVEFIIGLFLLLFATEKFVMLAKRISSVLRISPLVIGITVVAIGTSIPELVVSATSMFRQDASLAMGNIIGSNIVNVLLVLPVGIMIGNMKIGRIKTQKSALFLFFCTAVFFAVHYLSAPRIPAGLLLIGIAAFFSIMEYGLGVRGRDHEDAKPNSKKAGTINPAQMIIGAFLIVLIISSGILIVEAVESLSLLTGLSTSFLGMTLSAIATSLPELLTTIYSQNNKQEKLTVGNIIGSNVYNLMMIGGILLLFPHPATVTLTEWIWLGSTTIGFVLFLKYFSGKKPSRIIAFIMLAVLLVYIRFQ